MLSEVVLDILIKRTNSSLFQRRTVKELLWGYTDPFLSIPSGVFAPVSTAALEGHFQQRDSFKRRFLFSTSTTGRPTAPTPSSRGRTTSPRWERSTAGAETSECSPANASLAKLRPAHICALPSRMLSFWQDPYCDMINGTGAARACT